MTAARAAAGAEGVPPGPGTLRGVPVTHRTGEAVPAPDAFRVPPRGAFGRVAGPACV